MLFIEPTQYKTKEKYHYSINPYIETISEAWLPGYSLAVSKGYPGILANSTAPSLIQVELFQIKEEDVNNYKSLIANRHMTWETITELYDTQGKLITGTILAPVLRPINSIFSMSPIYYLADNISIWTQQINNSTLEQKELTLRKLAQQESEENYYPTAMEI